MTRLGEVYISICPSLWEFLSHSDVRRQDVSFASEPHTFSSVTRGQGRRSHASVARGSPSVRKHQRNIWSVVVGTPDVCCLVLFGLRHPVSVIRPRAAHRPGLRRLDDPGSSGPVSREAGGAGSRFSLGLTSSLRARGHGKERSLSAGPDCSSVRDTAGLRLRGSRPTCSTRPRTKFRKRRFGFLAANCSCSIFYPEVHPASQLCRSLERGP